ncbi:MAG: hypothetical protein Q7U57_10875 [Methylovulum sp.]|nr:hypothetical protein [Methylovulum sp.]
MTLFNKSLGALVLAALSLPANAVNVTVHNQAHYLVSFEVNGRHSGNFSIGQSRTMDNASGTIRINWLVNGFIWCSTTEVSVQKVELQVGEQNVEIFFQGDVFTPHLRLRGFDIARYFGGSINLNHDYGIHEPFGCDWRRL